MAPIVENQPSCLLSNEENSQVFKLLGNRCQTLSTTVVQLYLTQAPHHSQWMKKCTGVLCFVKDNTKKNFFFRVFCLRRNVKLWEQEMYNNMEYTESTNFFHMFEGQECLVAFNFANVEEARDFRIVVHQKIQARKRREEKRNRQNVQSHTLPPPTTNIDFAGLKKKSDPAAKQAKRKRNITKADIGIPKDFKHISHVGWDNKTGFDITTEDEQLREFFKQAGVTDKQLQDISTREYIYDFINKNGGREAVIEVIKKSNENNVVPPPAVPPRGPARSHIRNAPPPPIPNKTNNLNAVTPQRPKPITPAPKKPAPIPTSGNVPAAAPPPPPPPPPLNDVIPPPPPPMTGPPSPRVDSNMNSALLESIRNGTTLKAVQPVEDRKVPVDDAREDLLSEIRRGCKLKPVDDREVKPSPAPTRGNDLVSALAKALEQRNMVLHSEDDDDQSDDSSGLDWDD